MPAELFRCCSRVLASVTLAGVVALAAPAGAVILKSGNGNTTAPPDDPGFAYVGKRGDLSAVYLGAGWVLTANHVLEGPVTLDEVTYAEVVGSKVQLTDGLGAPADLAAFQIVGAPDWPLLPISAVSDISGQTVTMIGQGWDRGASTSGCVPPRNGWLWGTTRSIRWGENVVDSYSMFGTTHVLSTTFDAAGLTHEAQAANGDSGGAVFVKNAGQWELAGTIIAIGGCQGADSALFTNVTLAVDLAPYRDSIIALTRPECADEVDNDGDGNVDFPADAGCTSELDTTETPKVPVAGAPGRAAVALALLAGAAWRHRAR